jgi:hypothetical protein
VKRQIATVEQFTMVLLFEGERTSPLLSIVDYASVYWSMLQGALLALSFTPSLLLCLYLQDFTPFGRPFLHEL